jgi:hypothetical protein
VEDIWFERKIKRIVVLKYCVRIIEKTVECCQGKVIGHIEEGEKPGKTHQA